MTPLPASNSPFLAESFADDWAMARAELSGLASYRSDWDGEGALPAGDGLVAAATRLFDLAEQENPDALPPAVSLAPDGTILLAWYFPGGGSTIANVRATDRAELIFRKPGRKPEFQSIPIPQPAAEHTFIAGGPASLLDDDTYALAA